MERKTFINTIDRRIIVATQNGLPLTTKPYHDVARQLELEPAEVMQRMQAMQACGVIRRIGAVPNHYRLGYTANGMSVWDVPDEKIEAIGNTIGELPFVSHCYQRPRRLPQWPYCLFAMVHGRSREEVEEQVQQIAGLIGDEAKGHAVLYSTRILKKTGLRLAA